MTNIQFQVLNLLCEYAENPIGIDTARPRFSWRLSHPERDQRQTAYQILVASGMEELNAGIGDKWDSGKVLSDMSAPGFMPIFENGR